MRKTPIFSFLHIALLTSLWAYPPELGFAEMFFQENDYYRAATEFQRAAYMTANTPFSTLAHIRAAESFYLGNQYTLCLEELLRAKIEEKYKQRVLFLKTFCTQGKKEYHLALELAQSWPHPFGYHQQKVYRALLFPDSLHTEGWLWESEIPLPNGLAPPLAGKEYLAALENREGKKIPILGAVLSSLMPGLGQIYYGSWGDALSSFLVVASLASFGYVAHRYQERPLSVLFFSGAALFYVSSVYGAYLGAERKNKELSQEYEERVLQLSFRYEVLSLP
ncbi:MAG: hypothetical protein NZM25_09660 [Leptospiraceae bacterium]|nr:hypothetical protein [Leptospiraceae bacterium]MDW8306424.1 hypothetical protein [Leptospiraceae bacterium]